MILIDTGPLIALFDPADSMYRHCVGVLKGIHEPIYTTIPVLTEAFHILTPASIGSNRLRDFIIGSGISVWHFDSVLLRRAFELMEKYADHPMDLADASLIAAAETLKTRKIFTIDRNDFNTYRIKHGHKYYPVEIVT